MEIDFGAMIGVYLPKFLWQLNSTQLKSAGLYVFPTLGWYLTLGHSLGISLSEVGLAALPILLPSILLLFALG